MAKNRIEAMAFLPIVGRELRAAARRRATYRTRLLMAGGAFAIGACILFLTLGVPPQQSSVFVFQGLAGLALAYCLFYGRQSTADCLSVEKREGTLGLLFLTDLKGHDIVLGKLAATALNGFYGLLAILPVLAVPLLMGGITVGEFWRVVLVLLNTFLFSLAVGILISSISRDARWALGGNLLLLLAIVGVPPAIAGLVSAYRGPTPALSHLLLSCPPYSFYLCADARFKLNPDHFWESVGLIHVLSWFMLFLASRIIPHAWQDRLPRTAKASRARFRPESRRPTTSAQRQFRERLLDENAFLWLAVRRWRKLARVWVFVGFAALWWFLGWATGGRYWLDEGVFVATALLVNTTLKLWFAIEAGQQLAEDRRLGTLEVLLSTPMRVRDILGGQWLALRRQFAGPLLVIIGVELVFLLFVSRNHRDSLAVLIWPAGMLMLVADLLALGWVSMWQALRAKSPHEATFKAAMLVLFLPLALAVAVTSIISVWCELVPGNSWRPTGGYWLGAWFVAGLLTDIVLGSMARWQLQRRFRELALGRLSPATSPVRPLQRSGNVDLAGREGRGGFRWRPALSGKLSMRAVIALTLVFASFGMWFLTQARNPASPPPLVISLTQSNAPLRVFPGGAGAFLVLPDCSLWRWSSAGAGQRSPAMPERVGANQNWTKVLGAANRCLGLRSDGTLWQWSQAGLIGGGGPVQVGIDQEWADVAVSGDYAIALRRDGTMWEWGTPLFGGVGGRGPQGDLRPSRLGTNAGWTAVSGSFTSMFALRDDGSVWVWGHVFALGSSAAVAPTSVLVPTRFCRETNWAGFETTFPMFLRTFTGEAWEPSGNTADPEAPVTYVCRRVPISASPGRFTAAFCGDRKLYELRKDGTLWERLYPLDPQRAASSQPWRRVGVRSDWVALYGAGATAFGLTSDGTLWMWGYDPTRVLPASLVTGLQRLQLTVSARLRGVAMNVGRGQRPFIQKEPRPLLKMDLHDHDSPRGEP